MTNPTPDPLETFESVPAVSFHAPNGGHAKGEVVPLKVLDWPKLLEQKDDDGNVERWDNGDPKLVLVISVEDGGEKKSLWAKKMGKKAASSMFQQIAKAQKVVREETGDLNYRLKPGDTLFLKYDGDDTSVPPKKGNHPKMFKAKIVPGEAPPPAADALADDDSDAFAAVPAAKSESDPFGSPLGQGEPPF
jgi:hypothetical protein